MSTQAEGTMDEVASKKQRVSFEDTADFLGSSLFSFRTNDIIDLTFKESPESPSSAHKPDFTHQLFDNETVQLSVDVNINPCIKIAVDCFDLSHTVTYPATLSEKDLETLSAGINKALPEGCTGITNNADTTRKDSPAEGLGKSMPPGSLIHQFSVGTVQYEIYLATAKDSGASELLHRAEKVAMWYIETADSVDFSDDRWEALFLYAVDKTLKGAEQSVTRYFAGYMTLFSFRNPFRGTKLRVCQALVLPHRQGHGLGREMLLCVYKHIVQPRGDICELTVEDPAVGFQRLRDAVDFELFVSFRPDLFASTVVPTQSLSTIGTAAETADSEISAAGNKAGPPSEQEICTAMKIIKAQAQFLLESVDYVKLVRSLLAQTSNAGVKDTNQDSKEPSTTGVSVSKRPLDSDQDDKMECLFKLLETSDAFKTFRLKVKRRILKNDKELSAIAPKSEMQKALSEEFAVELKRFHALESTAKRLGLVTAKLDCLL
eukprot:gene21719-24627_t